MMATKALNEMITSPMALVAAAFIDERADQLQKDADENGTGRIQEATTHLARRFAKLLREAGGEES